MQLDKILSRCQCTRHTIGQGNCVDAFESVVSINKANISFMTLQCCTCLCPSDCRLSMADSSGELRGHPGGPSKCIARSPKPHELKLFCHSHARIDRNRLLNHNDGVSAFGRSCTINPALLDGLWFCADKRRKKGSSGTKVEDRACQQLDRCLLSRDQPRQWQDERRRSAPSIWCSVFVYAQCRRHIWG